MRLILAKINSNQRPKYVKKAGKNQPNIRYVVKKKLSLVFNLMSHSSQFQSLCSPKKLTLQKWQIFEVCLKIFG